MALLIAATPCCARIGTLSFEILGHVPNKDQRMGSGYTPDPNVDMVLRQTEAPSVFAQAYPTKGRLDREYIAVPLRGSGCRSKLRLV